jgi:hypothetical protein
MADHWRFFQSAVHENCFQVFKVIVVHILLVF